MDLGIKERVALVTGGSQGIGRAAAQSLAQEGARVAITYRHDRARAESVADSIHRAGGEALVLFADLDAIDTLSTAVRSVIARWGRLDILINNAVKWSDELPWESPPFESVPVEKWQAILRANIEGAYVAIQAALPAMRAQRWGRIVNVSSGVAVDGVPGAGPYAAAKAALHGLTKTLAKELGPAGILTNVVMPGLTMTEAMAERLPKALQESRAQHYPIRRLLPPEEVVPTIVFLASALNTAVTGEILRASGGTP